MTSCNCCTTYSAPDLMDGGVTAALIEKEVAGSYTRTDDDGLTLRLVQQQRDQATARAERAERDAEVNQVSMMGWAKTSESWQETAEEWENRALKAEKERDEARKKVAEYVSLLAAPLARSLTPDDIKSLVREREQRLARKIREAHDRDPRPSSLRIAAAVYQGLTEPARPEGAEELARLIAQADVGEWDCGDLADALLATGRVRVTGAES